jgi:Rod binding domain-containing protein
MDIANLILNAAPPQPTPLEQAKKADSALEAGKKQFARDFESVFINKLLDEMKNTIGEWGEEKDGAAQQIDGIFWLHLARDLADKGGFGMAKDIEKFLTDSENKNTAPTLLDKNL